MTVRMLQGDCREVLRTLPDESVHCVVTSPPYWGLRDYGIPPSLWDDDPECEHVWGEHIAVNATNHTTKARWNHTRNGRDELQPPEKRVSWLRTEVKQGQFCQKCGAWVGARGLEPAYQMFVSHMVEVFREVRRVLRADGTLWLNLGDSYATGAGKVGEHPGGGEQGERWKGNRGVHTPAQSGKSAPRIEAMGPVIQPNRMPQPGLKPKDLCGIPWRVAFALQAPQYLGSIKNETDRAWMAALTDGEGCISILEAKSPHGSGSSYPPILQVRMCDRECIDKAMAITGTGGESPAQYPASMEGQRPAYQWRIHGRKAADTIAEIYPFLLIKRKQAVVAWNHQAVRDGYETKRGVKIPTDALEKQLLCRELIQKLNHREPVDMPSWMVEPPQPFGPGWWLRQDLIWSKPNPMPESVTDRCTKAHEYLFLLAKSERYCYDADAIAEESIYTGLSGQDESGYKDARRYNGKHKSSKLESLGTRKDGERLESLGGSFGVSHTRNKRSVWEVATQPFSEAHFATFPPDLIEPCILAGCPAGGTVLDPFGGAGTTGLVADRLGRDAILIELNPTYAEMAKRRIEGDAGMFASITA